MPKVSVVIPTYNRSKLVRGAINSVLNQSFTDFEIIVVDDGSTDDTHSVIEGIADDRVKYLYKDNGGCATARNRGMANSQGDYLAFLESDDIWPKNFLEVMLSCLEDNPEYGGSYCLFRNRYPDGKEAIAFNSDRYMSGWLTINFFNRPPFIIPSATLFHRSVWKNFWWDEALRNCDDIDAFLRLSTITKFLCVPDVCIVRLKTSDSLTDLGNLSFSPTATLILERFYFHLGGDKIVPAAIAKRQISRHYRGMARQHYRAGNRRAAILLFKRAINYYPFGLKNYRGLLKALALSRKSDKMPNWQMPKPLPPYITVGGMKIEQSREEKI